MASPDPILAQSAKEALLPLLAGKSDREIANALLKLLQFGVAYEVDQEQSGKESYMEPAQVLFYPAADCEDKEALFAQLFRLFSNAPLQAIANTLWPLLHLIEPPDPAQSLIMETIQLRTQPISAPR
ncbi:hypothetical protein [Gilvimarinus agarilyticus]|uniref:hypothetical protein n=1 Tax=Gilvimarinus agarilyticus TaxID=679259 RepID=UPI0005A1258B|nr:hypothetical protein [Gilvimarinus agarilyticus]